MKDCLEKQLLECRKKRGFDAESWLKKKVVLLNDYMRKAKLSACIVNASGGVDSSVTLALCDYAASVEGSPIKKVIGLAQPINSTKSIQNRAFLCKKSMKHLEMYTIDQSELFRGLVSTVESSTGLRDTMFAGGQLKSYMRTPVAFYVAQLYASVGSPAIVVGTGNMDEDGYLCYFCKAGDGIADIQLLADLHKSEVFKVGRLLEVPPSILEAPPSADLWEGQTDEDELGFSYDFVELFTTYLTFSDKEKSQFLSSLSEEGRSEFERDGERAKAIHERNKHKLNFPLNLDVL